jgi:DNA-binding response OmpR family regulator
VTEKPKILIVDDKTENLFALEKTLQKLDAQVYQAKSGNEALGLTIEHEFCMAIVDVQMPEMDGYELVELMRGNEATATLPVIFVSAIFSDEYHHRKGYDSGAVDFMSKPFIPEILLSKVRVFIELYNQRRRLQDLVTELNQTNVQLSRRAMQLATSNKIGQQITSNLNIHELLPQIVHIIQTQFNFSLVSIWLVNEARDAINLDASTATQTEAVVIPMKHGGLVAKSCRSGERALENNAFKSPAYVATPGLRMPGSELSLPLTIHKETLGALDIQSERLQAFSPDDISALEILTSQIVIAIRNARMYSMR